MIRGRMKTERQRLCLHVRGIVGWDDQAFAEAMAIADAIHLDGIGSMQAALDATMAANYSALMDTNPRAAIAKATGETP